MCFQQKNHGSFDYESRALNDSYCTGGEKLKIKGGMSDASINIDGDPRETSADAGQLSASTSGVSSACSGSLQQLSVGVVTPDISDPNTSLTEKCDITAKGILRIHVCSSKKILI